VYIKLWGFKQKKQRKELKAESQTKTNKNKDYRFATAALQKKNAK